MDRQNLKALFRPHSGTLQTGHASGSRHRISPRVIVTRLKEAVLSRSPFELSGTLAGLENLVGWRMKETEIQFLRLGSGANRPRKATLV
jgi:hypothetical protein